MHVKMHQKSYTRIFSLHDTDLNFARPDKTLILFQRSELNVQAY